MYIEQDKEKIKNIDLALVDVLWIVLSFYIMFLFGNWVTEEGLEAQYVSMMVVLGLFDMLYIALFSAFSDVLVRGYFLEAMSLIRQGAVIFLFSVFYMYLVFPNISMPVEHFFIGFMFYFLASYAGRIGWKHFYCFIRKPFEKKAMLIILDSSDLTEKAAKLSVDFKEQFVIKGWIVSDRNDCGTTLAGVPVVCSIDDAPVYICHNWVDDVFIDSSAVDGISNELVEKLSDTGVILHLALPVTKSALNRNQFVEVIEGHDVLTACMARATAFESALKRVADIAGALVGCLLTAIIFVFLAPVIKLQSPGPVFFKQKRVGKNGKVFEMYKFRSMYPDAEARKKELAEKNRIGDGRMFKMDFDLRIIGNRILPDGTRKTGVGQFIRRTSLDEFPQFFNVLKGDMSLVGTRPPTLDEWERYEPHHRARLAIKPGITGMWQVSGRSKITDFEEVVRLDKKYINEWSVGLDLRILLKTVLVIFKCEGAM